MRERPSTGLPSPFSRWNIRRKKASVIFNNAKKGSSGSSPAPHNKLFMREILEDSYQIIVPPEHPFALKTVVKPEDLAGQPIIIHEKGSAPRKSTDDVAHKHGGTHALPRDL